MPVPELAPADGASAAEATTGTLAVEESAKRSRRRRSADRDGATEEEKSAVSKTSYECRFCLMRFEKSQALGGHMNRHRQEREKEQFHHAQQLVSSMAQQQMPRTWTSLAATASEIPQLPSDAALSRLSSQYTGGATRPYAPPISFTSYCGQAPTSASYPSVPSSLSSNYYVPSNSSSCNNNVQQQQNLHWSADGFSTAATPRSAPQSGSFHAVETISTSLQATGVQSEILASMLRASANNNNNNNNDSLVSSGTPTNTAQGQYDLYSSYPTSFFSGM